MVIGDIKSLKEETEKGGPVRPETRDGDNGKVEIRTEGVNAGEKGNNGRERQDQHPETRKQSADNE